MTELAAAYIEEVAEGRIPNPDSAERKAYDQWSKESAQVTGTWAEFALLRIQSAVRLGVDQ
jgi:hypothetical protein